MGRGKTGSKADKCQPVCFPRGFAHHLMCGRQNTERWRILGQSVGGCAHLGLAAKQRAWDIILLGSLSGRRAKAQRLGRSKVLD